MKTSKIGLAMLNDEREHVWVKNNPENMLILQKWAEVIKNGLKNKDGSSPDIVISSEIITSIRKA